jgi:hypothetical protein
VAGGVTDLDRRMLNGALALYDVPDIEAFCVIVLMRYCSKTRTRLRQEDFDDGVAFLIGEAWRISQKFDAARGARFSSVAYSQLTFRCVDYQRKLLGRTKWTWSPNAVERGTAHTTEYERERTAILSLDAPATRDDRSGTSLGDTLDQAQEFLVEVVADGRIAESVERRSLIHEFLSMKDDGIIWVLAEVPALEVLKSRMDDVPHVVERDDEPRQTKYRLFSLIRLAPRSGFPTSSMESLYLATCPRG